MPRCSPPTSTPVQYFPNGNLNDKPLPAIIAESFPGGLSNLNVFSSKGNTVPHLARNVYMVGDPDLATDDKRTWAEQFGGKEKAAQ